MLERMKKKCRLRGIRRAHATIYTFQDTIEYAPKEARYIIKYIKNMSKNPFLFTLL